MSEKEYIKECEAFFSFDSNDERYEIVLPKEEEPMYGTILHIEDGEKEILNIQAWALRFINTFGYKETLNIDDITTQYEKEDDTILFTGPFGTLKISKACNLTYERVIT
jgi:hypothetical protein